MLAVNLDDPAREKWREIVPAAADSIQGYTLQAATASGRPVVLLYDNKAGHAGGAPLSKIIDDLSLKMSFLFWQLEMN